MAEIWNHSTVLQFIRRFTIIVCVSVYYRVQKNIPNNNRARVISAIIASIAAAVVAAPLASIPPTVIFIEREKTWKHPPLSDNECLLFVCGCIITLYYLLLYNSHLGHATHHITPHHTKIHFHYIFNRICIDMVRLGMAWLGFGTYACSQWMFNDATNLYE